jgi:hypothetical protein
MTASVTLVTGDRSQTGSVVPCFAGAAAGAPAADDEGGGGCVTLMSSSVAAGQPRRRDPRRDTAAKASFTAVCVTIA